MYNEQFWNIYVIVVTVVGLVISMFRYIERPHRIWFYLIVFELGNLMSNYYWGTYIMLMQDYPVVTSFMAYLGWSISYIPLILTCFLFRTEEEKHYFNPLCLVPIPLNIAQFMLYLPFGGALNNLYQGLCCTTIACMSLNSILYYLTHRKQKRVPKPFSASALLFFVLIEYTMWTSSCFDWPSDETNPYTYASIICFTLNIVFVWVMDAQLRESEPEHVKTKGNNILGVLKPIYTILTLVCCVGGYVFAVWIKRVIEGEAQAEEEGPYAIIVAVLFVISLIVVMLSLAILLLIYISQKTVESETLKHERDVAEQSSAAKSDFLASMSHEIRTPINAVLGMNEMILRESLKARDLLPREREMIRSIFADICNYSGNIESAGNNLLAIINDILDFSKIEAGHLELTDGEYKLSSVLNDVSNMVSFKAKDKGLEFTIDVDEAIPDGLLGDEVRVRQVMTNILNNAVKYTEVGSVRLTLRLEENKPVVVGEKICLVAAVSDTGIGIKEEDLESLFNKFQRVDLVKNSTVEGTGLGLAITKSVLEMMGGRIEVQSTYGKGSVFTAYIPQTVVSDESVGSFKEKFAKAIEETSSYEESFRAPDAHILVVDDTRMNLLVAEGLLKGTQVQMDMVTSGAESIELARSIRYDLILMDQRMPIMDGTEAMNIIRADEQSLNRDTPFICLTADAVSGAKERYLSAGFTDYLSKPIDSKALERMLRKYLPPEKLLFHEEGKDAAPVAEPAPAQGSSAAADEYATLRAAGINPETGLSFSLNDPGLYRTFLAEFLSGTSERQSSLESSFQARDWESYGIQVHSLKSTSNTIGALSLSKAAQMLETAAREHDEQTILEGHGSLMEDYRELSQAIAAFLPDAAEPSLGSDEEELILEFMPEDD
ncbi:MAG: ATP-binding protein [Coriobacteriales bacterium]|nr:ATP-binding protein [Coriobacteriales bacterium]